MKIKILVAAHKDSPMPKSKIYFPVLVGSDFNFNGQKGYQLDNEGDNISSQNCNFNELTAVYWAWKNLANEDVIGLVHYRRFFSMHHKRSIDNVLTMQQVEKLLQDAPVIVPKHRNYYIESNRSHYIHAHHADPLDEMGEVIKQKFPDYFLAYKNQMQSKTAHMFNMFIMKRNYFEDYCDFLFGVLFEVEKRIDISSYSSQEARVFGYLGELLMDIWLQTNNVAYKECNWIQSGKRSLPKKAYGFLRRKFKPNVDENVTHF